MCRILLIFCFAAATALLAKPAHPALPAAPSQRRHFENPYLSLQIVSGWIIASPDPHADDCCILTLTHGRYVLAINPLFDHAGPIPGGRFSEIINIQPSVQAVMGDVDIPAGGFECTLTPLPETRVNRAITLQHLYTDPAKEKGNQYGCHFPAKPSPVWYASFFGGEGPEIDYKITLTYDSTEIDGLPRNDSPELAQILHQVVRMLRTLRLKPPVVITTIVPTSAPPGATVAVYGTGLALPGQRTSAVFTELPNSARLVTRVAADGKSLVFAVPASITAIACPPGKIEVEENCVATPPGHIDINDCLSDRRDSCSIPTPSATYHLSVLEEGMSIWSNAVPFTVISPPRTPVSLLLLSPAYYVLPGDFVTLQGSAFTPTANTVHIGSVLVPDLSSADGSIRFPVPYAASSPFQAFPVFVSNANGVSNVLTLTYR